MILILLACGDPAPSTSAPNTPTPAPTPPMTAEFGTFEIDSFQEPCGRPGIFLSEPGDAGRLWVHKIAGAPARNRIDRVRLYVTDTTSFGDFGCDATLPVEVIWAVSGDQARPTGLNFESTFVTPTPFNTGADWGDSLQDTIYLVEHTLDPPLEAEAGDSLWLGLRVQTEDSPFRGTCIAQCTDFGVEGFNFSGDPSAPHNWYDPGGPFFATGVDGTWLEPLPE